MQNLLGETETLCTQCFKWGSPGVIARCEETGCPMFSSGAARTQAPATASATVKTIGQCSTDIASLLQGTGFASAPGDSEEDEAIRAYLRTKQAAIRATSTILPLVSPSPAPSTDMLREIGQVVPKDLQMTPLPDLIHRLSQFRKPKHLDEFGEDETISYIGICNTRVVDLRDAWQAPTMGFLTRMSDAEYRAYFDYLQRMVDDARRVSYADGSS